MTASLITLSLHAEAHQHRIIEVEDRVAICVLDAPPGENPVELSIDTLKVELAITSYGNVVVEVPRGRPERHGGLVLRIPVSAIAQAAGHLGEILARIRVQVSLERLARILGRLFSRDSARILGDRRIDHIEEPHEFRLIIHRPVESAIQDIALHSAVVTIASHLLTRETDQNAHWARIARALELIAPVAVAAKARSSRRHGLFGNWLALHADDTARSTAVE